MADNQAWKHEFEVLLRAPVSWCAGARAQGYKSEVSPCPSRNHSAETIPHTLWYLACEELVSTPQFDSLRVLVTGHSTWLR